MTDRKAREGHTLGPWMSELEVPGDGEMPDVFGIYADGSILVANAYGSDIASIVAAAPTLAARVEELEAELHRLRLENVRVHDEANQMRDERDRLWDALHWLDTFSPEDTAAMESRFGLDLFSRSLKGEGE